MFYRLTLLPVILIILGLLLLLKNFGFIELSIFQLLGKLWPLILIFIGIRMLLGSSIWCRSHATSTEKLSLEVGTASQADVRINFGAGNLSVDTSAPGKIVDGSFIGGVRYESSKNGSVSLSNPQNERWFGWCQNRRSEWHVGLTREVPLNLKVDVGAAESHLDLSELKLANLELNTGASSTTVKLPRLAGSTSVYINAGAASIALLVPDGVAARIRTTMALGSTDIDQQRFPLRGGIYLSPDYETAPNKVDIEFKGGVGSLQIS